MLTADDDITLFLAKAGLIFAYHRLFNGICVKIKNTLIVVVPFSTSDLTESIKKYQILI